MKTCQEKRPSRRPSDENLLLFLLPFQTKFTVSTVVSSKAVFSLELSNAIWKK